MKTQQLRPLLMRTAFIAAALVAGLGIARAQLIPANRAVGAPADDFPDGTMCSSLLAIDVSFGSLCSDYCDSDADCALPDWRCRTLIQGSGEPTKFCAPLRHLANP